MNFLLEFIITYKLHLPLSKTFVSLRVKDVFCCADVRMDLGSGGGDGGGRGAGGEDSSCTSFVMVFVLAHD